MNVSLTPELEGLIREKVESGMYQTASEVVREGLRLLRDRDEDRQQRLEDLRREIQIGVDEADRGELAPLNLAAIKAEGRKRLAQREAV